MSLLDKASLIVTPNAVKASKLFSVIPSSGAGYLDVVRNTSATRVNELVLIETVALNAPRIDYKVEGCPSILVEPQVTNTINYSQDLSNSNWIKTNVTILQNSTPSPFANLNTDVIVENSTSNAIYGVSKNPRVSNLIIGSNYFVSFFAKRISRDFCYFEDFNRFQQPPIKVYFNLSTGLVGSNNGGINAKMENYANGWYRCSFSFVASNFSSIDYRIASSTTNDIGNYTGIVGNQAISVTGFQLEQSSALTSYIPTTSAAVTRNQDVATVIPPIGTIKITTVFEDNTTQVLTTIPSTFTLPFGRIKYVLMHHTL